MAVEQKAMTASCAKQTYAMETENFRFGTSSGHCKSWRRPGAWGASCLSRQAISQKRCHQLERLCARSCDAWTLRKGRTAGYPSTDPNQGAGLSANQSAQQHKLDSVRLGRLAPDAQATRLRLKPNRALARRRVLGSSNMDDPV